MKRSQINYAIDKALAMAETFRISLPEFAHFTASSWPQKRHEGWNEVQDLQLGWDVTDFFSSPGFSNELMTLYYTDTLTPVTHKRSLDDDEFLNVEKLTLEEAQAVVADGLICDAKTIMALYYWQLQAK